MFFKHYLNILPSTCLKDEQCSANEQTFFKLFLDINNMIAARQLEKELRAEHEKEMKEMKVQLDEKQRKFEAAKARSRVLENTMSELKGRVATLLEKTTHDDQLISALTVIQSRLFLLFA